MNLEEPRVREAIVSHLDRVEPDWREAYDCNPYFAVCEMGLGSEIEELDGVADDDLEVASDDYFAELREYDE